MRILKPQAMTDAILTSTNVAETEHSAWSSGTTYAIDNRVIKNHKIWESLQNSNTNHDPEEVGSTWWAFYSYTNAWKMFDAKVGSQTTNSNTITLELLPGRIAGATFLNVAANEISIVMTDPLEGEVYNEIHSMIDNSPVIDLYTYFFEPIRQSKNLFVALPVFGDATVDIVIDYTGGTAKCGELVLGLMSTLGCTQFGAGVSITDYSVKQVDDFGNFSVLERAFSKRGSFTVLMENVAVNNALNIFEEFRATPAVWIPTDVAPISSPLIIYGYYRDFEISVQYYNESTCTIELEGLT